MRVLLLFLSLLLCMPAWTQLPTAEQKKLEADLKKIEAEMKKALNQSGTPALVSAPDKTAFKAPKKRTALLAAIPKKIFTAPELLQYIKTLRQKFELAPANKKVIVYSKQHLNYKTAKEFYYAAILFWYGKKQTQAVYASIKGVIMDPSDLNALNNLCAFLNMSGYPHKAIPLLKYGLSKTKDDAGMLNNMGQAYYQLGDLAASSGYLSSCTRIEPYHIEANNTQGHIASANGNTQAAAQFYNNSLKGGYNRSAASQLGKLGHQPADAISMPRPSSYPETDDNIGFECLVIPTDVTQDAAFEAQRQAEQEAWNNAESDYNNRVNEYMQQQGMNMVNTIRSGNRPVMNTGIMFEKSALIMAKSYTDYLETVKRLSEGFAAWKEDWQKRYAERREHACDGVSEERCCGIMRALLSDFQSQFAQRYNQYCSEMWSNAKGHSNTVAYWMPFFSKQRGVLDRDLMTARFILLNTAGNLAGAAGISYGEICLDDVEASPVTKTVDFRDPECNFSLKVPLVVGEFTINCEKMSLSGGEGVVGGVEYNFVNGQSTLSLGIGGQVQSGIVNAQASAQYFMTFDGNLSMQDAGLKYSAGVSAGEVNAGPLKFEAISAGSSVTVGVNSGVTASTEVSGLNTTIFSKETNLYSFSDN